MENKKMKKKILLAISALLVFGLAIVAYSYSGAASLSETAAMSCCCCSGDSCPMKTKDASGKEVAMSHENCDCCKGDGESCPMMKKDANGNAVKMEGASCCPMMKDGKHADMKDGASCPMMKKDAGPAVAATEVKNGGKVEDMKGMHDMKAMHGEGCSCPCCQNHKENKELKDIPVS
jgi:hypothetical protein